MVPAHLDVHKRTVSKGPIVVKPSSHHAEMAPVRITQEDPANPLKEAGSLTEHSVVRTRDGLAIVPSLDAKERMEDQILPSLSWFIRQQMNPAAHKPKYSPRMHHDWVWDPVRMEWREMDTRSSRYKYFTTSGWKRMFK